jgi:hypothetical protein
MTLLFVAALGYFGIPAVQKHYRFLAYQDSMEQEVRYRSQRPTAEISYRLQLVADSLGLPVEAGIVTVRKNGGRLTIEAHYDETFDLPGFKRRVRYDPQAQGPY